MKGDAKVISYLIRYFRIELTGHKQYLLHSRVCGNWGFQRLAQKQAAYSEEETHHAGRLLERILFLEGKPELEDHRTIVVVPSVQEQLELDRDLIAQALPLLREAIEHCVSCRDDASRTLLEYMVVDEEAHLHWLEMQLGLIEQVGLQKYLQFQM